MSALSDKVRAQNAALQASMSVALATKQFGQAVTDWVLNATAVLDDLDGETADLDAEMAGLTGRVTDLERAATPPPPPPPPPPATTNEGRVSFCMYATSQADKYDLSPVPTQAQKDWMNAHWNRAIIYVDSIASWLNGDWGYNDMLQIYVGSSTLTQHPEWVLRKASGAMVTYNGHYLADPGHPAYQDYKAAQVGSMAARNYKGCHADDVNLDRVVSGPDVMNLRTKAAYTLGDWQRDMADMMTKVRQAAPKPFEIVHNSLWWASGGNVDRCIKQADVFELERGFNDPNYTPARIVQVWNFVDTLHSWGVAVNHLSEASGKQAATFNLACALLCSNGHDYVYGDGWKPDAWDVMYDLNLGAAQGPRYQTGTNTWARDFLDAQGKAHRVTVDLAAKTGVIG